VTDASARARALDPHTSFIVRAPAGSGKTELLIQRYLRLLANVEAPESIVAITFTRKAAAEMRSRVLQALQAACGPAPNAPHHLVTGELARAALERDAACSWRLLQNPVRIRIQTIDSLCASITSRMPWLARFGAMPDIIEKAAPLYAEAARLTLTAPDKPQAAAALLLHLDNNFRRAENLLAQMLETRDQWMRHLFRAHVREDMENMLARIIEQTLAALSSEAAQAGLTSLPDASAAALNDWNALAEGLLTQRNEWRKKNEIAQRLSGNTRLLECFARTRNLPPARFTETQWRVMNAIVELLPAAVGNLGAVFADRGMVDFIELGLAAQRALSDPDGPTDLGLALGCHVHHVLLDEFQDTSYTHLELFSLLTQTWEPGDGRTVFLVGDPMQSIYRFRQAEVGLFLRTWRDGLANVKLEPLTLSVNFRSGAGVIEWVNSSFEQLFPACEDPATGAVSYAASAAADSCRAAAIQVHAFAGDQARSQEAERVADLAFDARQHGSVGILVRARSHLPAIVAALRARRIRYQAIEIDELGERAVIQDLMSLTFAILHPADRISRLAVLRAPWCGLTLHELYEGSPAPRRARTEEILQEAVGELGRRALRDVVEQAWLRLGGPACLESESELQDANAYFDVLEAVEQGGDISDFEVLKEQVRELFAQPDGAADGSVQIMTIHKAKGLEFDTVILPGLGAPPKRDENQLILWHEPSKQELLFAPIPETGTDEDRNSVYRYLSRLEQQKFEFEAIRLLYVAVTRARTTLHLLGCAAFKSDGEPAAAPGSFLRALWPVLAPHYAALRPSGHAVEAPATAAPLPLRRLAESWRVPEPPPPVRWNRQDEAAADAPEIAYEWVGDALRHVGTVVHTFLARIGRAGAEGWDLAAVRTSEAIIRAMLRNLGVSDAELQSSAEQVIAALMQAISDERGRWILGAHDDARCELAISGVIAGRVVDAVIDRTFLDSRGVRWIIDYKTGAHAGGGLEQFLANEKRRYQAQLERYATLLSANDDRTVRLGLYFPLAQGGWVEWEAPKVMRRQASLFAD
jgi:ATP-dependent exoDNAse (exonuclease V) beta subunit